MEASKCHAHIKALVDGDRKVSEVFVTDRMGANLCAYPATSDYDQGDEDKWFKPFLEAQNPYFGKAKKDASSGSLQIQASYLIKDGNTPMGVVVIGSNVSLSAH